MSNLWDGVSFKLGMAKFYLDEMRQDLIPATTRQDYVYCQDFTVPPVNLWAPKFYYHLDAFLAATRSVDLVITTTFGVDNNKKMKKWIATLPAHERGIRAAFQSQYDVIATAFRRSSDPHTECLDSPLRHATSGGRRSRTVGRALSRRTNPKLSYF